MTQTKVPKKQAISTDKAPRAIGPYSQAIRLGNLLFCSGQIPLDPKSMEMEVSDIRLQTKRVLSNLAAVLEAGEASAASVVKCNIFLKDMNDFSVVNEEYANFFETNAPGVPAPARACVEVARLPKDCLVEIEAIAETSCE